MIGEIAGDLLCGGRNAAAPGEKVRQVTLVRPPRVGCCCCGDEFQDFGIAAAQD